MDTGPGVGDWGLRIVSNNCVESESGPGFCVAVRCGGNILSDGVYSVDTV